MASAGVSDAQYRQIEKLGQLNGVALSCSFFDQTARIKQALVKALPKRRELGNQFEVITNEAYLDFIQKGATCPDAQQFGAQVDAAIQGLGEAFPP